LKAIAVGNIVPPRTIRPEMSPILESAILRAMNSEPDARFETLRDLGIALWPLGDERTQSIWSRSFGNGTRPGSTRLMGGPATVPQSPPVSPPKPARRWPLWLGAVALLGAVSGLGWYLIRPRLAPLLAMPSSAASPSPAPSLSPAASAAVEGHGATVETHSLLAEAPSAPAAAPGSLAASAPASTTSGPTVSAAKKRSARRTAESTPRARTRGTAEEDSDLDQMFLPTGAHDGQQPTRDADSDLRAAFPAGSGKQASANGAPLTD
jgi:hypothetical protein